MRFITHKKQAKTTKFIIGFIFFFRPRGSTEKFCPESAQIPTGIHPDFSRIPAGIRPSSGRTPTRFWLESGWVPTGIRLDSGWILAAPGPAPGDIKKLPGNSAMLHCCKYAEMKQCCDAAVQADKLGVRKIGWSLAFEKRAVHQSPPCTLLIRMFSLKHSPRDGGKGDKGMGG